MFIDLFLPLYSFHEIDRSSRLISTRFLASPSRMDSIAGQDKTSATSSLLTILDKIERAEPQEMDEGLDRIADYLPAE